MFINSYVHHILMLEFHFMHSFFPYTDCLRLEGLMLVFITTAAVWNLNTVQTPTKVQVFQYTTLLPPSSS